MADITDNIIIDTTGNTASMATDYGNSGTGLTSAHLPLTKMVWGDEDNGNRTSLTNPLPIQISGQSGGVEISGSISGTTNGSFQIINYSYVTAGSSADMHFLAVAGNTTGSQPVGISGSVQGITNGIPVIIATTGGEGIHIRGAMASDAYGSIGGTWGVASGILIQGTSAGATATVNGETFPGYGFGVPIAVTAGRRLSSSVDSVNVSGTVSVTGGWDMTSATDSVSVYGYDKGTHVYTKLYAGDGQTLGHSGDALNVNITNAGFTAEVTISAVTGVTNAGEPPLKIQGYTGSNGFPVTIRGEAAGAVDVVSNSGVNATVTNTVTIDDSNLIQSIEGSTGPLISTLNDVKRGTNQIQAIRSDLTSGAIRTTVASIIKPEELRAGSVSSTATASRLHTNMEIKSGITIKSSPLNNSNIMIGNKTLTQKPDQGYLLEPGESIYLEISNLKNIYHMISYGTDETATLHYVGS